jgi:hypothetical protein
MATWDDTFNASPAGSATPGEGDDRIRETRLEIDYRIDQEHNFHDTASTGQCYHKEGSAMAYYTADASPPTLRPDGVTALGADDTARLRISSDTGILQYWNGSAWADATVQDLVDLAVYTWHKVTDPGTGWFASKTSGWQANSFAGGLTVDFSSTVTEGTKAIKVVAVLTTVSTGGVDSTTAYWRKYGDTNIADNPYTTQEFSHILVATQNEKRGENDWVGVRQAVQAIVYLDDDYKAQFAIGENTYGALYISYPMAELR